MCIVLLSDTIQEPACEPSVRTNTYLLTSIYFVYSNEVLNGLLISFVSVVQSFVLLYDFLRLLRNLL